MSLFSNLFRKNKESNGTDRKDVEDFMVLIRVYYQAVMAMSIGITNINFVPDLAAFKRSFKIATQSGKLGLAEKSRARKMLMQEYGLSEAFFNEIDSSIKKGCKTQADVQSYFSLFQGFANDLMMLMGNLMQWKFRIPSLFKKTIKSLTEQTVNQIMTKDNWKKDEVRKTVSDIRKYKKALGYSESWMTEYVYTIVMIAKQMKKKDLKQD